MLLWKPPENSHYTNTSCQRTGTRRGHIRTAEGQENPIHPKLPQVLSWAGSRNLECLKETRWTRVFLLWELSEFRTPVFRNLREDPWPSDTRINNKYQLHQTSTDCLLWGRLGTWRTLLHSILTTQWGTYCHLHLTMSKLKPREVTVLSRVHKVTPEKLQSFPGFTKLRDGRGEI